MTKPVTLSRRQMMRGTAAMAGAAAAQSALPAWMPRYAFAPHHQGTRGDVLISVFLRGGADSLNIVVPHGEEAYYTARPKLAIPRPDAGGSDPKVVDIDGFFGLHPSMAALLPIMQAGALAAIHAAGSPHDTRSHFEAMDYMERGTPGEYGISTGWIGRHLATLNNGSTSPLRAIGFGVAAPAALAGPISPVALQSIVDYHLGGDAASAARMLESINRLYALDTGSLVESARATRDAIDVLAAVHYAQYQPRNGAEYPQSEFALALRQTAALIRADVGLEAACIDLGGWDTHVNQGGAEGQQARLLGQLAEGLAAFHADMGPDLARVSVVVMSEFGRRVQENSGGGTDHGHGGAMLILSGGLARGGVIADWPGMEPDLLDRGEDLAITTDYRDVLAELIALRLRNPALAEIFPNHTVRPSGIFRAQDPLPLSIVGGSSLHREGERGRIGALSGCAR
ncbi:MAG: DUF1501 domain-containing protein [Chloroflexi bacterium]|nr:DUF1501 domain-containing protein [Chloroflexota bacterium]